MNESPNGAPIPDRAGDIVAALGRDLLRAGLPPIDIAMAMLGAGSAILIDAKGPREAGAVIAGYGGRVLADG